MRSIPSRPGQQRGSSPADHGFDCGRQARRHSHAIIGALLIALLHHAPDVVAEPPQPLLEDLRFEKASREEETIHVTVRDFSPPEVFALEGGKPRVVCDFLGAGLAATVETRQTPDGDYIKRIRVGVHRDPAKIRVVLDLAPQHDYDVRKMFVVDRDLFILAIAPSVPESDVAKGDASSLRPHGP
jgi:hypothetical protein